MSGTLSKTVNASAVIQVRPATTLTCEKLTGKLIVMG